MTWFYKHRILEKELEEVKSKLAFSKGCEASALRQLEELRYEHESLQKKLKEESEKLTLAIEGLTSLIHSNSEHDFDSLYSYLNDYLPEDALKKLEVLWSECDAEAEAAEEEESRAWEEEMDRRHEERMQEEYESKMEEEMRRESLTPEERDAEDERRKQSQYFSEVVHAVDKWRRRQQYYLTDIHRREYPTMEDWEKYKEAIGWTESMHQRWREEAEEEQKERLRKWQEEREEAEYWEEDQLDKQQEMMEKRWHQEEQDDREPDEKTGED